MVKKSDKKETVTVSNKVKSNNDSNASSSTLNIIMFVVIAQLVITMGVVLFMMSNHIGNSYDEKISSIDSKVSAIDSFFAANVPEYNSGDSGNAVAAGNTQPSGTDTNTAPSNLVVDSVGEPMLGSVDAQITIYEFSDYECPFCARFFSETYLQLKADYIDTGKVNLVFKDFPLGFHQMATPAAIAANCVFNELGNEAYFEMHDLIFENQQTLSQTSLDVWAAQIGVDEDTYNTCKSNPEVAAEVAADLVEGQSLGVSGTPSFIIDGELLVGAQPYSEFKRILDAKLN